MSRFASLRVRLAGSMLLVLIAALLLSSVLDDLGRSLRSAAPALLRPLAAEPFQDGLVLGSFGLVVAVLIWLVSGWSLRPVRRAADQAAAAGPSRPGARIGTAGLPTEIRPLVTAMNGALDRLEAAMEVERRFTADAAHELRTPLSVLTLRLQQARTTMPPGQTPGQTPGWTPGWPPDWAALDQDIAQMTRLVSQLLDLARKEAASRTAAPPESVNLARCARAAAATILPLVEQAGRTLHADLPATLTLQGHAADLQDMLTNLLENALLHGKGQIRLRGATRDGRHLIDIEDEGPALPACERAGMFERFRKASAATPGTGLGLAIVRQVAQTHGGTVAFLDTPNCQIRVSLPAGSTSLNRVISATGLPSSPLEITST